MADGGQSAGVFAAAVPVVVAIIGVLFGWLSERDKARKAKIAEVYAALLKAQADTSGPLYTSLANQAAATGDPLTTDELKFMDEKQIAFIKANADIVLYGSREVVTALSDFYDVAVLGAGNPRTSQAFVNLMGAMRRDVVAPDYPEFGRDADNIVFTGPLRRALAMQEARTGADADGTPGHPAG